MEDSDYGAAPQRPAPRHGAASAARRAAVTATLGFRHWLASPPGRGVIKCTLAYSLASLAVFAPPLSALLGRPDGKHVVATITVYFHASRSAGSMVEAVLVASLAVAYAELVSLLSMATSVLVGSVMGLVSLAHALVVVVFVGGAFGLIGWFKQRMADPLVNVGSTLASLAIVSVVTKESSVVDNVFSNHKILQVLEMLLMGVSAATAVNLLLWRVSARDLLHRSVNDASAALGDMLALIVPAFFAGRADDAALAYLDAARRAYAAGHERLAGYLREAKFERYIAGQQRLYALECSAAAAIGTLSQSMGGLSSAATAQLALLHDMRGREREWERERERERDPNPGPEPEPELEPESTPSSAALGRASGRRPLTPPPGEAPLRTPADMFDLFVAKMRPHMEPLAHLLSRLLCSSPFAAEPPYLVNVDDDARHRLADALGRFSTARADALEELYRLIEQSRSRSDETPAELEHVAAACGHFSFSLQSLGEDMTRYLDVVDDLKYVSDRRRGRSWRWLMWWRAGPAPRPASALLPLEDPADDGGPAGHVVAAEHVAKPTPAASGRIPTSMVERRDTFAWRAAPNASRVLAAVSQGLLRALRTMARDDIRFGLKVGIGASLWAMLAFIDGTRDWYMHYRGEWGLVSFMIVCSMTVGASNTAGWSRFLGTLVGASLSILSWKLSRGNGVALAALGSLIAFGNFYLIVARGKAPLGRTALLAYNVSTLHAYSLSQRAAGCIEGVGGGDEGGAHPLIVDIAQKRAMSVLAGILWGLVVCRLIWPISARQRFKEGLAVLYLQMGLIWRRGPLATLLRSDCARSYVGAAELAALRRCADRLEALRRAAASEFELRGPFPSEACGRIMACTNRILDAFYAMSLVARRGDGRLTPGERALLLHTAPERAVLCDGMCHAFHALASSMMLEYPLMDAVPSVAGTRDRLLARVFDFRRSGARAPGPAVEERDYALLYAYALVTRQVAGELAVAEAEVEGLFGLLSEESSMLLLQSLQ